LIQNVFDQRERKLPNAILGSGLYKAKMGHIEKTIAKLFDMPILIINKNVLGVNSLSLTSASFAV